MGANHHSNGNGVSVESYPEWELSPSRPGLALKELMEFFFFKDLMVHFYQDVKVSLLFSASEPRLERKKRKRF